MEFYIFFDVAIHTVCMDGLHNDLVNPFLVNVCAVDTITSLHKLKCFKFAS